MYVSDDAQSDLDRLYYTILLDFKAPFTAFKYLQVLKDVIRGLSKTAEIYKIETRRSLRKYGMNVRRVNYKKMTIIYTVHSNLVYIHRIIPQNTICEL